MAAQMASMTAVESAAPRVVPKDSQKASTTAVPKAALWAETMAAGMVAV
jgi:hypothetical protein